MQPKKFSEYTPITETDGTEVIPILKAGVNATVKSEDLPISTATQTAIDAADADIAAHVADVANPHQVTKAQVGLGSVDNTSDATKPVSTAQATAIALKADQATTYTKTEVDTKDTDVADTAQTNLTAHTSNTSNPHSTTKAQVGLGNADNTSDVDKPISTATQTALDAKATNTALDVHTNNTSNPHSVTKSQVGLGSVDNTSDINKPVSTAQVAALALKADVSALNSHTSNTLNPHDVTKAQVGLGNVDNTSDVNKPISTATQTALNAKANASGTVNLTGDQTIAGVKTFSSSPIVPTATTTTQAVNKAQMDTADALKVNKAGDTMTGLLTSQSIFPSTTTTYNIGSTTFRYSSVWGQRLNINGTTYIDGAVGDRLDITASAGFRINGVGYITGTGFPNGVVSAPVGSIYIDTAVTNGASSWIKKSGTGNTGWQVLEGDTGTRNITALVDSSIFTTVNAARIRRVGNQVEVAFDIGVTTTLTAETDILSTAMASGFVPTNSQWYRVPFAPSNASSKFHLFRPVGLRVLPASAGFTSADGMWRVGYTYMTSDAWPTTLPGAAV